MRKVMKNPKFGLSITWKRFQKIPLPYKLETLAAAGASFLCSYN
jgi:hypothetical protein